MIKYQMILRLTMMIAGWLSFLGMVVGIIYYHCNAEFSDLLDMYISRYTIVLMYLLAALFLIGGTLAFLSFLKIYKKR